MGYIFFGIGAIGKSVTQLYIESIENLLFFVDNNTQLWGSTYQNKFIYSPEILKEQAEENEVVITCSNVYTVYNQLISYGIPEKKIIIWTDFIIKVLINIWDSKKIYIYKKAIFSSIDFPRKVFFDLQNGLTLGGVESWTFQISRLFRLWNIDVKYLIPKTSNHSVVEEQINSIEIDIGQYKTISEKIKSATEILNMNTPSTIICNFVGSFFWSACYSKHLVPDKINLISIIHSDTDMYYNSYILMERYIDICLVISRRIEKKLLERGFPKEKIRYLSWNIPCHNSLVRAYSIADPILHIGYAGRITIPDKRCDLLWTIILSLSKQNMEFCFEIAGNGDYLDELVSLVKKEGLLDRVHFLGFIPREQITAFWEKQDIMVSCSDIEGHSISQVEAMACGAVPVITDTSGARDDVIDGKNGFIVEIGSTNQIVEKICYLNKHREQLRFMGENAHKSILEKNDALSQKQFWNEIFKIEK